MDDATIRLLGSTALVLVIPIVWGWVKQLARELARHYRSGRGR